MTNKKETAFAVVEILKEIYPDAVCSLTYDGDPWRLLVMARLSAQCTDARVNTVSETLFGRFPDAASMAAGDIGEIESLIFSCGLYHTKAADIKAMSALVAAGGVPDTMDGLLALPGVGRKIANLILGDLFGQPAIVTDTHCIRISKRLGLSDTDVPVKTERELAALIPPEEQSAFCHRLVLFGREFCQAKTPLCGACKLRNICPSVREAQ